MGLEWRNEWHNYKSLYEELKNAEIQLIKYRRRTDDPFVIVEPLKFKENADGLYACSKNLEFSREGKFTCPVETFLVFISEEIVDVESEDFSLYDNLFESADLDNLIENDLKIPKTYELIEGVGFQYRLFKRTYNKLKPVLWGKFTSREGVKIETKLNDIISGRFLYVKLVNPENRMTEMNDLHDHTNIDASYVQLLGHQIDFFN